MPPKKKTTQKKGFNILKSPSFVKKTLAFFQKMGQGPKATTSRFLNVDGSVYRLEYDNTGASVAAFMLKEGGEVELSYMALIDIEFNGYFVDGYESKNEKQIEEQSGLFPVMVISDTEFLGPFPKINLYLVNNTDTNYLNMRVLTGALMSMGDDLMETSKSVFGPFELESFSAFKIGGSDMGEMGDFIVWYDIDMDDDKGDHHEYRISLPKSYKLDEYPLEQIPFLDSEGRILELLKRKTGSIDDYIKEKGLDSKYIEY